MSWSSVLGLMYDLVVSVGVNIGVGRQCWDYHRVCRQCWD